MGHDVYWFVRKIDTDFDFEMPIVEIADVSEMVKYDLDVLIVNKPKDYYEVKGVPAKHLVYLSQAYEIDHMNIRREKKKRLGHPSIFGKMAMNVKWGLKKRRIHKMYADKEVKWAVSPYLMDVLKQYGCPTKLVRNSFDEALYNVKEKRRGEPLRLLSVGDYELSRKNLPFLFEAIAASGGNFHFTRVSPNPITEAEKASGLVDEFYTMIPEDQLARIYRESDVLVSSSTDEGFGLPVIEAMACGALCLLSDIGAYREFAKIADAAPTEYALFFNPSSPKELAGLLDDVSSGYERYDIIRRNGLELTTFYTRAQMISDLKTALADLTA